MAVLFVASGDGLTRDGSFRDPAVSWTDAYWVLCRSVQAAPVPVHLLGDAAHSTPPYVFQGTTGGSLECIAEANAGAGDVDTPAATLTADTWVYLAEVYDAVTTTLMQYVNAVLVGAAVVVDLSAVSAQTNEQIGPGGNGDDSDVAVGYARTWQAALTAAELVAELSSTTAVRTANLLADTPLTSPLDLTDVSGNGEDWSLVGSPTTIEGPLEALTSTDGLVVSCIASGGHYLEARNTSTDVAVVSNETFAAFFLRNGADAHTIYGLSPSSTLRVVSLLNSDLTLREDIPVDVGVSLSNPSGARNIAVDDAGNVYLVVYDITTALLRMWFQKFLPTDLVTPVYTLDDPFTGSRGAGGTFTMDTNGAGTILYYGTGDNSNVPSGAGGRQHVYRFDLVNQIDLSNLVTLPLDGNGRQYIVWSIRRHPTTDDIFVLAAHNHSGTLMGGQLFRYSPMGVLQQSIGPILADDGNHLSVALAITADGTVAWIANATVDDNALTAWSITDETELLRYPFPPAGSSYDTLTMGVSPGFVPPPPPPPEPTTREAIRFVRIFPHVSDSQFKTFCSRLEFEYQRGVGTISGQGANPQAMVSVSYDGGITYMPERFLTMGAIGRYLNRMYTTRFSASRDFTFRLVCTDPVLVAFLAAYGDFEGGWS